MTKWKDGDFREVDKDHNKVLKLQGGNVGHAYVVPSLEDEKICLNNSFKQSEEEK